MHTCTPVTVHMCALIGISDLKVPTDLPFCTGNNSEVAIRKLDSQGCPVTGCSPPTTLALQAESVAMVCWGKERREKGTFGLSLRSHQLPSNSLELCTGTFYCLALVN